MATLSLALLGGFRAWLDDQPVSSFQTRKVQALLIYLTAEPGQHSRESLLDLMWPGMPSRSARHNLRQVLYYLRSTIPDLQSNQNEDADEVPLLLANRQMIQLNPEATVMVDVAQFESLMKGVQLHEHISVLNCQGCLANLAKAIDIYQGDFLVDFYLEDSNAFEDWAQLTREAYRRKVLDALDMLTAVAIRQSDYAKAQAMAQRQLEIDNLRENAYRQLMEALALAGHREEALAVYDNCRRLLAEELSMRPTNRTTEIAQKIQAGDLSFETPPGQGVRGYELKEEIGAGMFGTIHRAYQSAIDREVAVKVIHRRYANDPEFIRRFEDEAQTVARLEHPYIVPLYDYWRDPDGAYLVMRYLRGGSLLSALENSPWNVEAASQMLDQVASALSVAHRQSIIHRDIKPANILLDESGNAYLSDFGIAKELDSNRQLTAAGAVVGTVDYISPEQILNEQVGPQSDIYSLGAVLYETLTGEKPFGDSSLANLIYKQLNDPLPLVGNSRPDLSPQIDQVIQKATAKRPADRYQDALEMARAFRRAWQASDLVDVPVIVDAVELYNPYKGLQAFQEADEDDFFGRDALVARLLKHLRPPSLDSDAGQGRFLALVGPSGSGKSSIVKAGLIPALRSGALPGSKKWFIAEMVPGTHPLEELEMALWSVAVDPPPSLVEPMQRDVRGMLRTIRRVLPEVGNEHGPQLLLVIDQFEELFTLVEDEARRYFFMDSLLAAISAPRSPLRVAITLRADFYDRPLQLQAFGELLRENTEVVLPMMPEELIWAIREPARHVGVTLQEGLVEVILADVVDQPGSLPMMQYALTELFERRHGAQMTLEAYKEIGGVMGALGRRAEKLYRDLGQDEQEAARQLFLRLVTLGEGVEDTRRRVLRSELEAVQTSMVSKTPEVSAIIDAFGAARLLTFDRDPVTRGATVEVAHEALLREWGRYRSWLADSRDDIRLQRKLTQAAVDWTVAGEDESYLLRGARLAQLEAWSEASGVALTKSERAFLRASVSARQARQASEEARRQQELQTARQLAETESRRAEEQASAAQRLRRRAIFLVGALLVAALLAAVAIVNGSRATQNAAEAEDNLLLATTREAEAVANANLAATQQALAQENVELAATRQVEAELEAQARTTAEAQALASAAEAQNVALVAGSQAALANGDTDTALALAWQAVALYPDSARAQAQLSETAYTPGTVRLFEGHTDGVTDLDVSPDEKTFLSASWDGSLILWDIETGEPLRHFDAHTEATNSVSFSEDGRTAVSGSEDTTAILWDVQTGQVIRQFVDYHAAIVEAQFSPDGRSIVAGGWSEEYPAIQWDVETGQVMRRFEGDATGIQSVGFALDGSVLLAGSNDDTLLMWDFETGELIYQLDADPDEAFGSLRIVVVNPDGLTALVGFEEMGMVLWDLTTGELARRYDVGGGVFDVAYQPENDTAFISSVGNAFRKIDLATGALLDNYAGHGGLIQDIDLVDNGRYALTAAPDFNTIRLWELLPGQVIRRLADPSAFLYEVDLSPDGRMALAGTLDGTVTMWDVETGQTVRQFIADQPVMAVRFSPDGQTALIGTGYRFNEKFEPGNVILWDIATGEEIRRFVGHPYVVFDVEFSPDGKQAISSGNGSIAILWDVETGQEIHRFEDYFVDNPWPVESFWDVEFSPDGSTVLAAYSYGPVIQWDVETGAELGQLAGHDNGSPGITFSNDGQLVASGGFDDQAILWDSQKGDVIHRFTNHSGPVGQIAFAPGDDLMLGGSGDGTNSLWDVETGDEVRRYGDGFVIKPVFGPDGSWALVGFVDGTVELWRIDATLDELLAWTEANRHIPELTCEQRLLYGVEPLCEAEG